jgi:hypothetical protein
LNLLSLFLWQSGSSFLARRDDCPESYCHDPGVGGGVGVTPQGKTFNLR